VAQTQVSTAKLNADVDTYETACWMIDDITGTLTVVPYDDPGCCHLSATPNMGVIPTATYLSGDWIAVAHAWESDAEAAASMQVGSLSE
jgi:hypothetical protein